MKLLTLPPANKIKDLYDYDSLTGLFWRRDSGRRGDCKGAEGYRALSIGGRKYRAHRIAWLLVHGREPAYLIDHINGDRGDNRIENLREATPAQNIANSGARPASRHGFKGITPRRGRWRASIKIDCRSVYLGTYDTPEAAHAVYLAKAREIYGEFVGAAP